MDLAAELLQLQAKREAQPGHAFDPDNAWQKEFEASFPFTETPDQMVLRVCRELGTKKNIIILNDESHRSYDSRPTANPSAGERSGLGPAP